MKRSLSTSRSSLHRPDDAPHTTDPVYELDEERAVEKGQGQDDSERSEESSTGPPTPAPPTPVLDGLSSPPKDESANRILSSSPGDSVGYNPPTSTTAPIPAPITHPSNTSDSAPRTPLDPNGAPVAVPHSAPPDKVSHGSKMWSKFARSSNRGKKLNAALDKTGTLVRVMSAGFSSKSTSKG